MESALLSIGCIFMIQSLICGGIDELGYFVEFFFRCRLIVAINRFEESSLCGENPAPSCSIPYSMLFTLPVSFGS